MSIKLDITLNICDVVAILEAALAEKYKAPIGKITCRSWNRLVFVVADGTVETENFRHHLQPAHTLLDK